MKLCPTCQRTYEDQAAFCPQDGALLQTSGDPLLGQTLDGQYALEALLAHGHTGAIYRARHMQLGDQMALKIFNPELCRDATWLRRFQREGQAARRFRHPNAVTVYDVRTSVDGHTYMVMEYVAGHTLEQELQQRGRFAPHEALEVLEPVARALDAAGAGGITCDFLTPADIMIGRADNSLLFVKLLPLIFNRRFVEREIGFGSPESKLNIEIAAAPYIAPELWRGYIPTEEDTGAAVYSLGVISYEMLSGQKPYDGLTPREIGQKHVAAQPTPLSELTPNISILVTHVVQHALAKEGKQRPATGGEFVWELQDALELSKGEINEGPLKMAIAEEPFGDYRTESLTELESPTAPTSTRGLVIKPKAHPDSATSVDASVTERPLYTDENVQFSVYQPEAIAPARWHTLLAFAHLAKRRPDAPPDEPEPLAEVQRIAARVLADQPAEYDAVKQNSLHAVPRKGELMFVPIIDGCEFNPPSQSFFWLESVHKVEFKLRAAAALDGQTARGRLTVFLGGLILADVPLAIRVDSASGSSSKKAPTVSASAEPYRKIFASYSHKDRVVVERIEHNVHALGDKYLRDVRELRAGQDWQRWMRDAIHEADVFQLFWSHNSMRSTYVRQEWEYALSLNRQHFIRPTYWEIPLPESPLENLPPAELRQLHFQHLQPGVSMHPAAVTTGALPPLPPADSSRQAAPAATPTGMNCAACGTMNRAGAAFCRRCCTALSRQQPTQTSSPVQMAMPLPSAPPASVEIPAPTFVSPMPMQTRAATSYSDMPSAPLVAPMSSSPKQKSSSLIVLLALLGFLLFVGLVLIIYFSIR